MPFLSFETCAELRQQYELINEYSQQMTQSPPSKTESNTKETDYTSIMLQRYQKKIGECAITDQEDIRSESHQFTEKSKYKDKY